MTKGKEGYIKEAAKGDHYLEFDMNSSILKTKDVEKGWMLITSKNQMYIKLAEKKGQTLPSAKAHVYKIKGSKRGKLAK